MSYNQALGYDFSDDGFTIENGIYYISGATSPVGVVNPAVPTLYQQTTGDMWYHKGTGGINAWVLTDLSDIPSLSQVPVFANDGTITSVTFHSSASQVTANRIADVTYTYDVNLNPATEVYKVYSVADGTTVLQTVTKTFTFTANVLTNVTQVTT